MEDEKVSLSQRENSAAETIASLNKENARLRAQVIELETPRNNVSHQNQLLKEQVSNLQSKIRDLESSMATRLSSKRTMRKSGANMKTDIFLVSRWRHWNHDRLLQFL